MLCDSRRIRALVSLGLLLSLIGFLATPHASAQASPESDRQPRHVQILFTGKLLGYFRLPDEQPAGQLVCPDRNTATGNVRTFLDTVDGQRDLNTVLVGMGDNFAPELFARVFRPAPLPRLLGKELYAWDWSAQTWVRVDQIPPSIQDALAAGQGRIPVDNVGCFLAAANYAAVVPGKHDFYFGPERVRELARFLATPRTDHRQAVQMLAANLVIGSNYAKKRTLLTDAERRLDYVTRDRDLKPLNVADGQAVLPFLRQIVFKASPNMGSLEVRLWVTVPGNPSSRRSPPGPWPLTPCIFSVAATGPPASVSGCTTPLVWVPRGLDVGQDLVVVNLNDPRGPNGLRAGEGYALCFERANHPRYCLRFSVDYPFFLFPNTLPRTTADGQPYNDPEPYLWECLGQTPPVHAGSSCPGDKEEVAIFGVVDPRLKEHVGELNYAWWNDTNRKYKTEIGVMDPAEALEELLQDFDLQHRYFQGTKILLAQMSLPLAQQLAARLRGRFQVVLAEAQVEHATPDQEATVNAVGASPSFVAVPEPYYDPGTRQYTLRIAALSVKQPSLGNSKWKFALRSERPHVSGYPNFVVSQPWFQAAVGRALMGILGIQPGGTLPEPYWHGGNIDMVESFQAVTLERMKQITQADVALMQKRDFFIRDARLSLQETSSADVPAAVERLLWKADLLVKRLVTGATLKSIIERSRQFDKQDAAGLSLEIETGRGLAASGATFDPEREEYLVNGEPLDEGRLYSVATTDYLGLGDTGYPELLVPPVGDPMRPPEFGRLYPISSLVAQTLGGPNSFWVDATSYLDHLSGEPVDRQIKTYAYRLQRWVHLKRAPGTNPWMLMSPLEREAQERGVWFLSLGKASGSFSFVRNNVTEAERQDRFAGSSEPQVQSPKSSEIKFESAARAGHSGRLFEWFLADELAHRRTSTGQKSTRPALNFVDNKLVEELGVFLHVKRREFPRFGPQLSLRDETQLFQPVENFVLSDQNKSTLTFRRDRTHTPSVRFGFRLQDRESNVFAGVEQAWVGAVTSFVFTDPSGKVTRCLVSLADPNAKNCVAQNSSGLSAAITSSSGGSVETSMVPRFGFFLKGKLVWPSAAKVSYVNEHDFEFFRKRRADLPTQTRFRYLMTHSVRIRVFANFSIAPKVELFMFENQVKKDFFSQVKSSVELNFSFDLFTGYRARAMRYKRPEKSPGQ